MKIDRNIIVYSLQFIQLDILCAIYLLVLILRLLNHLTFPYQNPDISKQFTPLVPLAPNKIWCQRTKNSGWIVKEDINLWLMSHKSPKQY